DRAVDADRDDRVEFFGRGREAGTAQEVRCLLAVERVRTRRAPGLQVGVARQTDGDPGSRRGIRKVHERRERERGRAGQPGDAGDDDAPAYVICVRLRTRLATPAGLSRANAIYWNPLRPSVIAQAESRSQRRDPGAPRCAGIPRGTHARTRYAPRRARHERRAIIRRSTRSTAATAPDTSGPATHAQRHRRG